LTPRLTPESPRSGGVDAPDLPSELAAIAAVWPELPDYIKTAIQALVRSWREGK